LKLAEHFRLPLVMCIDIPDAYPGTDAEERGQSETIARNLFEISRLRVPIICVVIGEGGSGVALAIGVGDRVLMLEYSTYSVISPEGCAVFLWRNTGKAADAIMWITADRLLKLKLIDGIITEPPGGAHRNVSRVVSIVRTVIKENLQYLDKLAIDTLLGGETLQQVNVLDI
jgi:acetyl-CoA carboxylase carboxyl transferase subunit alpha